MTYLLGTMRHVYDTVIIYTSLKNCDCGQVDTSNKVGMFRHMFKWQCDSNYSNIQLLSWSGTEIVFAYNVSSYQKARGRGIRQRIVIVWESDSPKRNAWSTTSPQLKDHQGECWQILRFNFILLEERVFSQAIHR